MVKRQTGREQFTKQNIEKIVKHVPHKKKTIEVISGVSEGEADPAPHMTVLGRFNRFVAKILTIITSLCDLSQIKPNESIKI